MPMDIKLVLSDIEENKLKIKEIKERMKQIQLTELNPLYESLRQLETERDRYYDSRVKENIHLLETNEYESFRPLTKNDLEKFYDLDLFKARVISDNPELTEALINFFKEHHDPSKMYTCLNLICTYSDTNEDVYLLGDSHAAVLSSGEYPVLIGKRRTN